MQRYSLFLTALFLGILLIGNATANNPSCNNFSVAAAAGKTVTAVCYTGSNIHYNYTVAYGASGSFSVNFMVGGVSQGSTTKEPTGPCSATGSQSLPADKNVTIIATQNGQGSECTGVGYIQLVAKASGGSSTTPTTTPTTVPQASTTISSSGYLSGTWTGVWNGQQVYLQTIKPSSPIDNLSDLELVGAVYNFSTTNPSYSCLNGEFINVWTAENEYPNEYIVHNGGQASQCAYFTAIILMPASTTTSVAQSASTSISSGTATGSATSKPIPVLWIGVTILAVLVLLLVIAMLARKKKDTGFLNEAQDPSGKDSSAEPKP